MVSVWTLFLLLSPEILFYFSLVDYFHFTGTINGLFLFLRLNEEQDNDFWLYLGRLSDSTSNLLQKFVRTLSHVNQVLIISSLVYSHIMISGCLEHSVIIQRFTLLVCACFDFSIMIKVIN
jgi:hypothetical protein